MPRNKPNTNYRIIGIILAGLIFLFLWREYAGSLFLNRRERISIGVFAETPFVYSYNRLTNLAHIVYFDPDIYVDVPGGYGLYRLGSVNLLGKIENRRTEILTRTFEELAGIPVDIVIYPKAGEVVEKASGQPFMDYFFTYRSSDLSSGDNALSTRNIFDRTILKGKFNLRNDRLIMTDATEVYHLKSRKKNYFADKLDTRLKGFFYQQSLTNVPGKVVIYTSAEGYGAAKRISRRIEGAGLKVFEIELRDKLPPKCQIDNSKANEPAVRLLSDYYGCAIKGAGTEDSFIRLYLDKMIVQSYK